MEVHKNAPLTPAGREIMGGRVIAGYTAKAVAAVFGVCVKTVNKSVKRCQAPGAAGLIDRSSRPHRLRRPTAASTIERIAELRRQRCTGKQIARELGVSPATVSRVLARLGLNKLSALEPAVPVVRYQREHPGEMVHLDLKKLGRCDRVGHRITGVSPAYHRRITGDRTGQSTSRGIGWEFVHLCIDDASRIAFSQIMPDERKESATAFLKAAIACDKSLGITVARVMTDNRSCYKACKFRDACRDLGLKHIRTKPCTPKTNGKSLPSGLTRGPSASFRPPCASGPMPSSTRHHSTGTTPCPLGCIATTAIDRTAA
jgi:transposase